VFLRRIAIPVVVAVAVFGACGSEEPLALVSEAAVLERERDVLLRTLARLEESGTEPLAAGDVLVAIREELIASLLDGILPITRTVDRFRITCDSVAVDFRGGLALVELSGRAELVEREDVFAEISILGTLEVIDVGENGAEMRARVDILGIRTRNVGAAGLSLPAERLVDRLSKRKLSEFSDLIGEIEIPVHLEEALVLPEVTTSDVSIPAAELPLRADLVDVLVSDHRMWLSLDLDVAPADQERTTVPAGDGFKTGDGFKAGDGAGALELTVGDSNRFLMKVPVDVSEGRGEADIFFKWDAATLASVVCGDFSLSESFSGTVSPRSYDMTGHVEVTTDGERVYAQPVFLDEIIVSPEPSSDAWARARQLLDRQNRISQCGLALDPADIEGLLRSFLTKGFGFVLPSSLFQPIPLPASVSKRIDVGARQLEIRTRTTRLDLTEEWLWYGAKIEAGGAGTP